MTTVLPTVRYVKGSNYFIQQNIIHDRCKI